MVYKSQSEIPIVVIGNSWQCRCNGRARGAVCPFWLTQNTVFETSRNDKTTDNKGKRNNYVQTILLERFLDFREIAGNQLLHINLMQNSVLFTRLYEFVAEETCKPAESLRVVR